MGKDIEKDLIENDPWEVSQTDRNTQKSNEAQSDKFQTIAPEKDNPVRKEFEIGQLGSDELQEDESIRTRRVMVHPQTITFPAKILMYCDPVM